MSAFVDAVIDEWRLPDTLQERVRGVLSELTDSACWRLRDPRLEVAVTDDRNAYAVWAYFPIHQRRRIAQRLNPKPDTRIMLVFSIPHCAETNPETLCDYLRDHIGHTLLYLRSPRAQNECSDADREWQASVMPRA